MTTVYTVNNKVLKNSANDKWLIKKAVDPYNPLGLPPNTVRVRTSDGNVPTKDQFTTYETATLVSGTSDVYDVYRSGTTFRSLLYYSSNVSEVLGANTTGITEMVNMFWGISASSVPLFDTSSVTDMSSMFRASSVTTVSLFVTSNVTNMSDMFSGSLITTVPLFDTSSVTDMSCMFQGCNNLTSIPLFSTSSATTMSAMFYDCKSVQSGALALYQQASSQTTVPTHASTFYNCGSNTTTGAAELAQIPSSWGGTGA